MKMMNIMINIVVNTIIVVVIVKSSSIPCLVCLPSDEVHSMGLEFGSAMNTPVQNKETYSREITKTTPTRYSRGLTPLGTYFGVTSI